MVMPRTSVVMAFIILIVGCASQSPVSSTGVAAANVERRVFSSPDPPTDADYRGAGYGFTVPPRSTAFFTLVFTQYRPTQLWFDVPPELNMRTPFYYTSDGGTFDGFFVPNRTDRPQTVRVYARVREDARWMPSRPRQDTYSGEFTHLQGFGYRVPPLPQGRGSHPNDVVVVMTLYNDASVE